MGLLKNKLNQEAQMLNKGKRNYYRMLEDFYNYEVPVYVRSAGKSFITIRASQQEGAEPKNIKITVGDVIKYYYIEARNITSGCRTLASFVGDWRGVDTMAKECLEWFKTVNRESLAREGRKFGMTLR